MKPVLFILGPLTVYGYGAMLALGVLLGIVLLRRLAVSQKLDPDKVQGLALWMLLGVVLGARIFFVLLEPWQFKAEPWRFFYLWDGGLVFYGGLLGGLAMVLILARYYRLPLLLVLDCLAPCAALGQAIGRLGCFMAGCCYGRPWEGPWAVCFTDPQSLAPIGLWLHPAQLYEFLGLAVLAALLLCYWPRRRRPGLVLCFFGLGAGLERLTAEYFRGDWRGEPLWGIDFFTPTAVIACLIVLVSCLGFYLLRRPQAGSV